MATVYKKANRKMLWLYLPWLLLTLPYQVRKGLSEIEQAINAGSKAWRL